MSNNWHRRFINLAKVFATYSKDPDTQVGCVIVFPDKRQFSMGYNGFPASIEDTDERLNGEDKNLYMIHAETNAILNARANLTGCSLYVTKPPCLNCCKIIISSGLAEVCCPELEPDSKWFNNQQQGLNLLANSGLNVIHFEDVLTSECETIGPNNDSVTDNSGDRKSYCDCNPNEHMVHYDVMSSATICLTCNLERNVL